jgi:hypothetical protein
MKNNDAQQIRKTSTFLKLSKKNNKENEKNDTQLPINVHQIVGTAFLFVNWLVCVSTELTPQAAVLKVSFFFTKEFYFSFSPP